MQIKIIHNPFDKKQRAELERPWVHQPMAAWFSDVAHEAIGEQDDYVPVCSGLVVDWDFVPCANDEIIFMPDIRGGKGGIAGILGIVAGVVLAVVGWWMPSTWAIAPYLIGTGIGTAVGGAMSLAASMFTPQTPTSSSSSSSSLFSDSKTYSWDGISNIIGDGSVVPIVYGKHRIGGIIVEGYIDGDSESGLNLNSYVNLLLALSEGPIHYIDTSSIQVNNQALSHYTGFNYWTTTGENSQSAISNFSVVAKHYEISGVQLKYNSPYTYSTQNECTKALITLMFPALYIMFPNMGGSMASYMFPTGVGFDVYYAPQDSGQWVHAGSCSAFYVSKSKIEFYIPIYFPYKGQWDIKIVRNTQDATSLDSMSKSNDSYLKSVEEIEYATLSYPYTALMGVRVQATDRLSGTTPNTTVIVYGRKLKNVNNLSEPERWSNNPADVLYDLLTSERYGLGRFITPNKVVIESFQEFSRWCDEEVSYQYYDGTSGSMVSTSEKRYEMNLVLDKEFTAYEIITKILNTCRAGVCWQGDKLRVVIDKPSEPTQLFTMGNIILDTFEETYIGLPDIPNSAEASFLDEDNDYKKSTVSAFDTSRLDEPADTRDIQLFGLTKKSRVKREVIYGLKKAKAIRKYVEFDAAFEAVACDVGDVILFQHNTPLYGYGGRIESISGYILTLSNEYIGSVGSHYRIRIGKVTGGMATFDFICGASGASDKVSLPGLNLDEVWPGCVYAIGPVSKEARPMRVLAITQKSAMVLHLKCEEYNDSVYNEDGTVSVSYKDYSLLGKVSRYELDGTASNPTPIHIADNPPCGDPFYDVPPYVKRISLREEVAVGSNGEIVSNVLMDWEAVSMPPNSVASIARYVIMRSEDGKLWNEIGTTMSRQYTDNGAPYPKKLYYAARPITTYGVSNDIEHSEWRMANFIETTGDAPVPEDVTGFTGVQNGSVIKFVWNPVTNTSLKHYEIRQGDWNFGNIVGRTRETQLNLFSTSAGEQRFTIKAVSIDGDFSPNAAILDITIHDFVTRNLILAHDDVTLGWPGHKWNMEKQLFGTGLELSFGETEGFYQTSFLSFKYPALARLWVESSLGAEAGCIVAWQDADFAWDDPVKANVAWSTSGLDTAALELIPEISVSQPLPADIVDVHRLNRNLDSVNGAQPHYQTYSEDWGAGTFHDGLFMNADAASAIELSLPDENWSVAFYRRMDTQNENGGLLATFVDAQMRRLWLYAAASSSNLFFARDSAGGFMNISLPYGLDDSLLFSMGSTTTPGEIKLMVGNIMTGQMATTTRVMSFGKPLKLLHNLTGEMEMYSEKLTLKGVMTAVLTKPDGEQAIFRHDNAIVMSGFDFICNSLGATSGRPGVLSHIGVGTGTTAVATAQTALVTELLRKAASFAHTAGTQAFTMTATFGAGEATGAITEAGVFNAASAGTMLDRVVFSAINKGAADILTVTFTFTFA